MLILLTGILSSIAAEFIMWIDKKLSGTLLQGDGAFVLAALVAVVGALVDTFLVPLPSFAALLHTAAQVWAVSQVFFIAVVQFLHLDVKPAPAAG